MTRYNETMLSNNYHLQTRHSSNFAEQVYHIPLIFLQDWNVAFGSQFSKLNNEIIFEIKRK